MIDSNIDTFRKSVGSLQKCPIIKTTTVTEEKILNLTKIWTERHSVSADANYKGCITVHKYLEGLPDKQVFTIHIILWLEMIYQTQNHFGGIKDSVQKQASFPKGVSESS